MKSFGLIAALALSLCVSTSMHAQQASAPAGSTGQCKDGTYTSQASKRGACHGHKGVQEWYAPTTPAAPAVVPAAPTAPPATSPSPPAAARAAPPAHGVKPVGFTPPAEAAPGGGPGLVWVNGKSKVYHCQGDKWYGKTKSGQYISESNAKAQGYHGAYGKSCS